MKSSARLQFTGEASSSSSGTLRAITIHDDRRNTDFQIVVNNHYVPEELIAELYRKRWPFIILFQMDKTTFENKAVIFKK